MISCNVMKIFEPITFKEANEHSRWQDAMSQEMESVTKNKTWTLDDLPFARKRSQANGCS